MTYNFTKTFLEFFRTERASGLVLMLCTVVSLILANSDAGPAYLSIWNAPLFGKTVSYWINDGLMVLFFLLVGLEIERELYVGELSQARNAALPAIAAIGGMCVPALVHYGFNAGTPAQAGIGIPMATDIAFALGVLSLLGNRVPPAMKIFLTALAIIDDLGAILIIAIFYTKNIEVISLAIAGLVTLALVIANRRNVMGLVPYLIGGLVLWYFVHASGVHATIAGVILAFVIPFRRGDQSSPSVILQHRLHYIVAFIVLPLFALANTGLVLSGEAFRSLLHPNSLGIVGGLVAGKFVGILSFVYVAVKFNFGTLPAGIRWRHVAGVSALGGIGFTMSMFIAMLAFSEASVISDSKIAILVASTLSALIGYSILRWGTDALRDHRPG